MVKSIVKYVLYLLGGLNMGVASAFCPVFLVLTGLIFGLSPITTPLGVSALLSAVVVAVLFFMHLKNCQKKRKEMDRRTVFAFVGFMLGVAVAILIALAWGKNETGFITGF